MDPLLLWPWLVRAESIGQAESIGRAESIGGDTPIQGKLSVDEREAYIAAAYEAIRILQGPCLRGKGPDNWQAIRGLAAWLEGVVLKAESG